LDVDKLRNDVRNFRIDRMDNIEQYPTWFSDCDGQTKDD